MYSVVLATMLVAGAEQPNWGRCHGCYSCTSCSYYNGCCTQYYPSCYCFGGHGCWVGGHHHHHYCGGCSCYCSGWSYCSGCCSYGWSGCHGCHGCCGGYVIGCCSSYCCGGTVVVPVTPVTPVVPQTEKKSSLEAPKDVARITVKVQGQSKVFVDEVECPMTAEVRTFATPALKQGTQYYYVFRMEGERNGQRVTENRRVSFAAGQDITIDFSGAQAEVQTVQR